jgi:predicted secreted Zn-dependent protease
MIAAVGETLSVLASSDDGEHGEEVEDVTFQGKLSQVDEPGWVMGTIHKTVQQCMERFRQKQMKYDDLAQPR